MEREEKSEKDGKKKKNNFELLHVVGGDDMTPSISPGEKLLLEKIPAQKIQIGDAIVFRRDILIAHRVVEKIRLGFRYYFFTMGDTCRFLDSPVSEENVIGKVVGKSHHRKNSLKCSIALRLLLLFYLMDTSFLNNKFKVLRTRFLKFISNNFV